MEQFTVKPIGTISASEKGFFIDLEKVYLPALEALDGFRHLNVLWWFSHFDNDEARSVLQGAQPYKKGPATIGVFATRSPVRPNPIALTAAEVLSIDRSTGRIQVAYIDAEDGTPVLDIKPYTPSFDRIEAPGMPEWCRHWPMSLEASGSFDWENEFNF